MRTILIDKQPLQQAEVGTTNQKRKYRRPLLVELAGLLVDDHVGDICLIEGVAVRHCIRPRQLGISWDSVQFVNPEAVPINRKA